MGPRYSNHLPVWNTVPDYQKECKCRSIQVGFLRFATLCNSRKSIRGPSDYKQRTEQQTI